MQLVSPMPYEEALQKVGSKSIIGSKLSSSEWSDVPVALRERALFSSRVEDARFIQRFGDHLTDYLAVNKETLPDGQVALATGSRSAFVDQMQKFAAKEGIPIGDGSVKDITSEARLNLIFDTNTRAAQDYGYWRQGMDADVLDEFPAQRFIRVQDVKEPRQSHTPYEDQVYLKTDPIWAKVINADFGVPWGPWGWGCGHDVEDVDRAEAESLGLLQPNQSVAPDLQNFNENLQASTRGLEPDLLTKLQDEFGERLVIDGDTMRWAADKTAPPAAPVEPLTMPTEQKATAPAVSEALNLRVSGTLLHQVKTGLAAIDEVHDDGVLPTIDLVSSRKRGSLGYMQPKITVRGLETDHIGVKSFGDWPSLTTVHEIGHFLDLAAIGKVGRYATESGFADMAEVIAEAEKTSQIKNYRAEMAASNSYREREKLRYFVSKVEIWARAYAQFIAEESGDPQMLADLQKVIAASPNRQWAKEDFAPISAAIKKMFKNLNWL